MLFIGALTYLVPWSLAKYSSTSKSSSGFEAFDAVDVARSSFCLSRPGVGGGLVFGVESAVTLGSCVRAMLWNPLCWSVTKESFY